MCIYIYIYIEGRGSNISEAVTKKKDTTHCYIIGAIHMEFPMLTPKKTPNMYSSFVPNIKYFVPNISHYISRFLISGVILFASVP